ncbi:hypothetical protein ACZ87_02144 [Candidatus Erwinia dacicola]|uniref:Uncharacterized protein n=1 Tax=Candidatus Erwinia dacicola TaxID=252393 RepID=A0A328TNK0_9GAMM|nr:hypothetical protein ACZ87_02144 [Candidatus Erwinia dacicola]
MKLTIYTQCRVDGSSVFTCHQPDIACGGVQPDAQLKIT